MMQETGLGVLKDNNSKTLLESEILTIYHGTKEKDFTPVFGKINTEEVDVSYKDKFIKRDRKARQEFSRLRTSQASVEKKRISDFI